MYLGDKLIKETSELLNDYEIDYEKLLHNELDNLIYTTGYSYFFAQEIEEANCDDPMWQEAKKINNASYKRTLRLKERIQKMLLMGQCQFLTLTFSNGTLQTTTEETRKKYIRRYLKENSIHYVANIDFGGKNGREHYHAIVLTEKVNYTDWHIHGAIKAEKIKTSEDFTALAKYVNKLANHAIKETTRRNHLIYSRL